MREKCGCFSPHFVRNGRGSKLTEQDPCEICNTTAETISPTGGDFLHQNCPRCGEFRLSGTAASMLRRLRSPEFIAKLSGWVRDQNRGNDIPMISSSTLDEVNASRTLSITEKSQRLLLEAIRGQKKIGEHFNINEPRFIAASHSQDASEVHILVRILTEQGLMKTKTLDGITEILPGGYGEVEKLMKVTPEPTASTVIANSMNDDNAGDLSDGTKHAGRASEFFRSLNIPLTRALRDLLTIAAAYSRAKKKRQNIISSTCVLFAIVRAWD